MVHLLMYSTNYTALAEALTTSKGMVGRRLLKCSDLSRKIFGKRIGFAKQCYAIVNGVTVVWREATRLADAAKNLAEKALKEARKAIEDAANSVFRWFTKLGEDIKQVFDEVEKLVIDVASFATSLATDLAKFINNLPTPERLMQMAGDYVQGKLLDEDGLCLAPSCPGSHINSGKEKDLVPDLEGLEILALTTLSVCFKMSDVGIDASGLVDAIVDFWENNPAAVKAAVDTVIQPIKDAIAVVEGVVKDLKTFFDGIKLRRRLEEVTHAELDHARGLKEHAHRQLEQVRGRLLHADNDHARDGTKERLQLDINRRLEAHFAERKLTARRLAPELITISNLKVSIIFNLDSRLLIEGELDKYYRFPYKKENDRERIFPLNPTPFFVKLAVSFSVDCSLDVKVEADFKALVHLVVDRMAVDFDLSTDYAGKNSERAVLSKGDWTHTIYVRSGL